MAYSGYFLMFGNTVLPNSYYKQGSYSVIPNQRTELSAYRDNDNSLHRVTSPNHKSKISFETGILTLQDKIDIQNIMNQACINSTERKYNITYWNDEENCYVNADFYMPDVTYTVLDTLNSEIIYQPVKFEFIQY